jgi:hypothetical protein
LQRWWNCPEAPHYHHEHRKSIHFPPAMTKNKTTNLLKCSLKLWINCYERNLNFKNLSKTQKHVLIPWSLSLTIRVQFVMHGIVFLKWYCILEMSLGGTEQLSNVMSCWECWTGDQKTWVRMPFLIPKCVRSDIVQTSYQWNDTSFTCLFRMTHVWNCWLLCLTI